MTEPIRFTKMHGAGNDYIYVNTMAFPVRNPEELAIRLSAPHTGIGSDGLVLIGSSKSPTSACVFSMRTVPKPWCVEMPPVVSANMYMTKDWRTKKHYAGNIIRHQGVATDHPETFRSPRRGNRSDGRHGLSGNRWNSPWNRSRRLFLYGNGHLDGESASCHFVEDITNINLPVIGPLLECHPLFPNRTNVEFVQALSTDEVRMKVWERGSGITQACGTGACATAVASAVRGKTGRKPKSSWMEALLPSIGMKVPDTSIWLAGRSKYSRGNWKYKHNKKLLIEYGTD